MLTGQTPRPLDSNAVTNSLTAIEDRASELVRRSKSANTIRAYKSDWAHFLKWCQTHNQVSLPAQPETIVLYASDLSTTHKAGTVSRRLSSIKLAHQNSGMESPTSGTRILQVMAGIRRTLGTIQVGKTPILVDDLRKMVARCPDDLRGARDKVVLLVGFAGAFRRSELVSLDVESAQFTREGAILTLLRSKTDQDGSSRKVGIPFGQHLETCPVRALQQWLQRSALKKGPILRPISRHGKISGKRLSGNAVARIVKKHARAVGLDAKDFAGHSLRAGLPTAAAAAGASERAIMGQTRHRSLLMVRAYIRNGSLFLKNPAGMVGL